MTLTKEEVRKQLAKGLRLNWEDLGSILDAALGQIVAYDAEVERLRAEVGQLHVLRADLENAHRLARIQADENTELRAKVANRDAELAAENAELRESLRRIVGHLEYEAKQGDGIAADAWDDYFAAKAFLGQNGMPTAASRGLASIRLEIAKNKPGAGE